MTDERIRTVLESMQGQHTSCLYLVKGSDRADNFSAAAQHEYNGNGISSITTPRRIAKSLSVLDHAVGVLKNMERGYCNMKLGWRTLPQAAPGTLPYLLPSLWTIAKYCSIAGLPTHRQHPVWYDKDTRRGATLSLSPVGRQHERRA